MYLTDKNISNKLKGIACIGIVLSHILPVSYFPIFRYIAIGYMWVGIFFFYSGYGLFYSYYNKPNYEKSFLINKFTNIYIPFIIAQLIYLFIDYIFNGEKISQVYIWRVLGIGLVNKILWYIVEIIILDIIFYITMKLKKCLTLNWYAIIIAFIVFLFVLDIYFDIGPYWYISTGTFAIGLSVANAQYSENKIDCKIKYMLQKYFDINKIIIYIILFFIIHIFNMNINKFNFIQIKDTYIFTFNQIILVFLFLPIMNYFASMLKNKNSKKNLLLMLGDVSLYIYLYHMCVKIIIDKIVCPSNIKNCFIYIICIVVFTILSSIFAKKSHQFVMNKCYRIKM